MNEATGTSLRLPLFDNAGTGRRQGKQAVFTAEYLQSHRPRSRPTEQASQRPGHYTQRRTADREV